MNRRSFLSAIGAGLATVALSTRLATTTLKLTHAPAEGDFDTSQLRYKATERFSHGWTDVRGSFGAYEWQTHGTSRLIVEDEKGELVELPRDHPVHVLWRTRHQNAIRALIQEASHHA